MHFHDNAALCLAVSSGHAAVTQLLLDEGAHNILRDYAALLCQAKRRGVELDVLIQEVLDGVAFKPRMPRAAQLWALRTSCAT